MADIKLFETEQKWYFVVEDVVAALTDSTRRSSSENYQSLVENNKRKIGK